MVTVGRLLTPSGGLLIFCPVVRGISVSELSGQEGQPHGWTAEPCFQKDPMFGVSYPAVAVLKFL